jgi:NADPH-dependent 2,4-dienoyl-CoA reductase/sulfur reductase-like enzyme/nitrite reductase/ring-hydroxylating ferredoxin subunit
MTAIRAASLAELQTGMTAVELDGVKVLLVRAGDDVRAFEGTCPHAKAPLEQGALCDGRIICPWHMGTFDARTGALLEPVAMRGLRRYPVAIEGDDVLVDTAPPATADALREPDGRVFVLAGSGAAAAMAAATLRDEGFTGRIVMIGPDGAEPLDRTQLSKMAIASADFDRGTLPLVDAAELGLERLQATVTAIDPASRTITVSTGAAIHYDAALLATGGSPKPPEFPGDGRVLTLRHLGDVDAILASVRPGRPAVVIGTSFIAMEAASALAEREMQVTVVGRDAVPFATLLGDRVGAALRTLHESKGVEFRMAAKVDRVERQAVVLASGESLPADLVVAGLGVSPVLDYAPALKRAGDGGLATDASLRVCDGVWAAGDIASPDGWPRIEHWRVAQQHGRIAALGMLGQAAAYEGVPFFWSAQAGKRLQMLGHASGWEEVAFDGDVEAFDFIAWYLKSGHVQAALICARDRAAAILSHAMRSDLTLAQARAVVAEA